MLAIFLILTHRRDAVAINSGMAHIRAADGSAASSHRRRSLRIVGSRAAHGEAA